MNTVKQSCSALSSTSPYSFVQSLSRVRLFLTPWTAARQASLSFAISQSLLKFISVESLMLSNHLILCCPLLLPSVFPSIGTKHSLEIRNDREDLGKEVSLFYH